MVCDHFMRDAFDEGNHLRAFQASEAFLNELYEAKIPLRRCLMTLRKREESTRKNSRGEQNADNIYAEVISES